ncbi:unnamed protein product [Ectocarpus sp. 12 AP-2014]
MRTPGELATFAFNPFVDRAYTRGERRRRVKGTTRPGIWAKFRAASCNYMQFTRTPLASFLVVCYPCEVIHTISVGSGSFEQCSCWWRAVAVGNRSTLRCAG